MAINEISAKVKELRELKRMSEELAAEIEALQDIIKKYMTEQNTEELRGTDWKCTWKTITGTRFDSAAFRSAQPELYSQFIRTTESRRFSVA